MKSLSFVWFFATRRMVAYQAPPSIGFSRQEYWRGLPFPSPADLPNAGIEPVSPALQTDTLLSEPPGKPNQFSSVQSLSRVWCLWSHESQHARPPCLSPTPGVHPDSRPSSQWCHPDISSSGNSGLKADSLGIFILKEEEEQLLTTEFRNASSG